VVLLLPPKWIHPKEDNMHLITVIIPMHLLAITPMEVPYPLMHIIHIILVNNLHIRHLLIMEVILHHMQ
jgi:hypothetical protein